MADYFQTGGACSGSWWSTERTGGFDGLEMAASVSCSTVTSDIGGSGGAGFSWAASELVEGKALSSDEPTGSCSGSGSSITFPDSQKAQVPDQMTGGGSLMDSTLHMASFGLSSPSMDWNQTLLRSSGSGQPSFHAILQESNQGHTGGTEDFASNPYKDMNQGFPVDQQHLSTISEPGVPLVPASYRCSSLLLQGLLEPENKLQQSPYDNRSVNFQSSVAYRSGSSELLQQPLWTRYPQLLKGSLPKQPVANQLQFSNSTPFWNASVGATTELRSSFYPPVPSQFIAQPFEQKPIWTNLTSSKGHQGGARDSSSGVKKSTTDQPAFKKPRIETPSPLPTFKVRKEKLGDRITALQQLVSPFGKTDTASVLHEAIDYIKFLHEQVRVLSTPYLKNGHPMQHEQNSDTSKDGEGLKRDLRSRGLCLVPIASTFPVESETTAEFWTPTFGGTYM